MRGTPTSARERSAWDSLDQEWFYLGRPLADSFEIATLLPAGERRERLAPVFTSPDSATPFLSAAPRGVELLSVAATDLRAKEEWLRAVISQGAVELAFDPDPVSLLTPSVLRAEKALWYVLSQRRATACL